MGKRCDLVIAAVRALALGGAVPSTSVDAGGRASRLAKALVACCVLVVAAAALFPSPATGATVPVTVTIDSVTNISAGDPFGGLPDFFTRINIANQSWFATPSIPDTSTITPGGWTVTRNVSSAVHRIPIRIEIYDDDTFLGIPASELIDVDPSVCPDGGLFGCAILTIGRPAVDYAGLDLNLDLDTGAVTPVEPSGDASGASATSICATGTESLRATVCFTITVGAPTAGETLVVTKTADSNDGVCSTADCSLREAIDRATPLDTISLPARPTPYQLTEVATAPAHLEIRKPVTIVGPSGGGTAIIEQVYSQVFRVFDVFSSGNLTLSNVTIRGGEAGDTSTALPGHIHGGGIHNHGTVTLTNVTITGNHAQSPNSTGGGGIYNAGGATLTMTNVTIAGNGASVAGGGIAGGGTIHARNVLVVDNTGPAGNCSVFPTDDGGNLQFPGVTCGPGFWTASVNPIGSLGAIVAGTYPLLPGSQAIDRGTNTGCPAADQLGFARPVDGNGDSIATCDPGAVEYDPTDIGVIHQPLDSAGQPGPVRLTFDDVLLAGFTTLLMPATGSAPPALYQHGTPARYYNLTTTALFSGQITVCIDYTGVAYADESSLRLFHHTAAGWSDETTSLDTSTNTICGKTTALSEFAVFEPDSTPPTITPTVTGTLGSNGWYTSDVGLTWTVSEPESPATLVKTGCVDQSITADQAAVSYSCSASSLGGTAGAVTVAIKRDATAPTLSFSGNAGSYTVAQNVSIGCTASDNLSGIASGCAAVSAPAYTFPLGANTVTRSATDNAGNTGTGSTSFTVVVSSQSLCTLTSQFVQGSAKYQALSQAAKRQVDGAVSAACALLANIEPKTPPAPKAKFIKAYKDVAQALAKAGWLTPDQVTTLSTLADAL